jgi:hypothetical protein
MTEDSIRKTLADLKMPKEAVQYVVAQADKTKRELIGTLARELRSFLNDLELPALLKDSLVDTQFEIHTTIKVRRADEKPLVERTTSIVRTDRRDKRNKKKKKKKRGRIADDDDVGAREARGDEDDDDRVDGRSMDRAQDDLHDDADDARHDDDVDEDARDDDAPPDDDDAAFRDEDLDEPLPPRR